MTESGLRSSEFTRGINFKLPFSDIKPQEDTAQEDTAQYGSGPPVKSVLLFTNRTRMKASDSV